MNLLDDEFLSDLKFALSLHKPDPLELIDIYEAAKAFHAIAPELKRVKDSWAKYKSGGIDSEEYSLDLHAATQKIAEKLEG